MKLNKILLGTLMVALVITSVGCSSEGEASGTGFKERNWKISHVRPEGTSTDVDVNAFAADLKSNSEGNIDLQVYAASQLGNYTVVQERVSVGDVDFQLAPAGTSVTKGMGIASAPYIAKNWDDVDVVFAEDGALMTNMDRMFKEENIKLLASYPKYFGGIALAVEPKEPTNADVAKGIKIRVPGMKAYEKAATELGYIATPIAYSEAFTAMQTGIVDGVVGSGAEGYYASFRDLTKHYLPLNDHFEMWFLYVSMDTWNGLSEDEKNVILAASDKFEKNRYAVAESEEQEFIDKLKANGTIVYDFTDAELAAFADKIEKNVWPAIKDEYGAEFFESVVGK